jgi:phage/plasmid-associated DNA primase
MEPTKEEIKELEAILFNILPIEEERKLYMNILYTGLVSHFLENFNIANGNGGNGKGLLNSLYVSLSGLYSYNCSNNVLLEPIKQGNNQSLALMNYKRSIFYKEPDTSEYKKLNLSTIKELTGEPKINAIAKYSIKSDCILRGTHILECNEKPKLNGKLDYSAVRRILDIPFRSTFVSREEELGGDNVFLGNQYYKTEDFKNKYRCALFQIILKYKTSFKLFIPKSIDDRTKDYFNESDDLLIFFEENYEKKLGDNIYIKCKDLYNSYKNSDTYQNMTKLQKKNLTYKKFVDDNIKSNLNFKKFYVSRYRKDGKDIEHVIINHIERKIINDSESDSDNEDKI